MKLASLLILIALLTLMGFGCAQQPPSGEVGSPGFLKGLLNGAIAPFALAISLFKDVRIYGFPNLGFRYDLGFIMGFIAVWGGGGAAATRRRC